MKQNEAGMVSLPEDGRMSREQGHALRNIFSVIIANAEMLGEALAATGQTQRRLERIKEACRRGEELVQCIRRPEASEEHSKPCVADEESGGASRRGHILVVDDEQDIVAIISRYLIKDGFTVQGMTDSRLALESLRTNPFAFDLLLTDMDMPFLSGVALCRSVHAIRPDLPVLTITGYDRHISEEHLADLGIGERLMKPLTRQPLLAAVRRLLPP